MTHETDDFPLLIQRHLMPVYGFVLQIVGNPHDAEDITQDVFVKAWKHRRRFDARWSFKTWIFTIAKRTAFDFLKKKKAIPFSAFESDDGRNPLFETVEDPVPLPSELFDRADLAATLARALEKLSVGYRVVLLLRYHEGLTFHEIGEVLGEPLHTVKSRHRRAILALRKELLP